MGDGVEGRRSEVRARAVETPLVVRVVPDIVGIAKTFDYFVPEPLRDLVAVGTIVRVSLHGRRVRAWVVEVDVAPPSRVRLQPIAKVTGRGPDGSEVELAHWAAWRWAGHVAHLLDTASPPVAVAPSVVARESAPASFRSAGHDVDVMRVPPAGDAYAIVRDAATAGDILALHPSTTAAADLATRLRRDGVDVALVPAEWARAARGGCTVVGSRAAVWAPVPNLTSIVVLDEHDESYQEERAPTWHARDVAVERARRAGVPCVLVSPNPSLEALSAASRVVTASRRDERNGWPVLDVVDRRREDPRKAGLYSTRLVTLLRDRDRGRFVGVLNRTGRARLLACTNCGELARCERCDAAVEQPSDGGLVCRRCGMQRPVVCANCGSVSLRNLRTGVNRAREELEALAGEPVGEITAKTLTDPGTRVVVGTEAALHHVAAPVGAVAFLDFDQELLAPRYRAAEQALALLARGARLVGSRSSGGRLLAQTRHPRHPVLDAVLHADPGRLVEGERLRRHELGFPPACALAAVSGTGAGEFIDNFGAPLGVEVLVADDDRWLLRARDHHTLCNALAATTRPHSRVRVEVDPLRV